MHINETWFVQTAKLYKPFSMRKFYSYLQLALTSFFLLTLQQASLSQPPTISYQSTITGLSAPIDIVNAGDGSNRLFIAQQGGLIRMWNGTALSNFMNLTGRISTGGERGLLSLAFHPDFNGTSNRYFFVYFTNVDGNVQVSRYQTTLGNPNTGDLATEDTVIVISHPSFANHNGGKLNFGSDGYLYFATGDGGSGNDPNNNAQTGTSLLGKMLRIDINGTGAGAFGHYSIPLTNPYRSDPSIADEIWALGLRNPFRWSFDKANGNIWIGDVGQGAKEEVDFRPAGSTGHVNYGWRCYEGSIQTPGISPPCTVTDYVPPVFDYDNPGGSGGASSAVTGGYVYRGNEYTNFRGYYIATDFYSGTVYFLWPNGSGGFNNSAQPGLQNFISGFGEAEDGTLYAVSQATGTAYKLVASAGAPLPLNLTQFSLAHFSDHNLLKWTTSFESNTSKFYVEYSTDRAQFIRAGEVMASRNANGQSYTFQHLYNSIITTYYRLAIVDDDGSIKYSSILKVDASGHGVKIYPTVIRNGSMNLSLSVTARKMQIVNTNGSMVFEKDLRNAGIGSTTVSLPALAKGIYFVQVMTEEGIIREKILIE